MWRIIEGTWKVARVIQSAILAKIIEYARKWRQICVQSRQESCMAVLFDVVGSVR